MVPVVAFWSSQRTITSADLGLLLSGGTVKASGETLSSLLVAGDAAAVAARLNVVSSAPIQNLSPAEVKAAVAASATTVGLLRADDVTADVRAMAIDGVSLFGSGRLTDLSSWPLLVPSSTPSAFASAAVWTLDAAGDVNLDREVYRQEVVKRKGPDYAWDGGTAEFTRLSCCNDLGFKTAVARTTGNGGAVRKLLSGADITIVNLEGAVPDNFKSTMTGYSFQFDSELLVGMTNAGIDAVTLANNHTCNAGTAGVLQTLRNLDAKGIAHTGAGANASAAREPVKLEAKGVHIALLGYDAIKPGCWAGSAKPGTARLNLVDVKADIQAARAAGADVVIVMPHWGTEYTDSVPGAMRRQAEDLLASGADLVLGSHSHWVGQIEAVSRPQGPGFAIYSLGNFVFDLTHDERTQEGIICDFTFVGSRLVQVDLHPTIIVNRAQPNLMDPAQTGSRVLDRIERTSSSHLHW
jgi:poly-gamma-glutamate synthesis protein (capsule biosynthesis protein)